MVGGGGGFLPLPGCVEKRQSFFCLFFVAAQGQGWASAHRPSPTKTPGMQAEFPVINPQWEPVHRLTALEYLQLILCPRVNFL